MSPSTSNPDPMMQPMWTLTANTCVLPVPGMGGHFNGVDPQMQQQAQSQAQISSLQQQNALLNQQLATQAASHIHLLQQFLQPPNPTAPSSSPTPQAPPPSEPPQPKVPPEVKTPHPPPFNTVEMVQKIRSHFKEEMMNTFRQFQDAHPAPTLPTPPTPTLPPQPLLAPPGVPQPSNIPRSPVPHRRSRSPLHTRDHYREDTVLRLDKRPVSSHRIPPHRRAKSTHSMRSHRQPSHSRIHRSLRLRSRTRTALVGPIGHV